MSDGHPYSDQQEKVADHTEKSHSKRKDRGRRFVPDWRGLRSRLRISSLPRSKESSDLKNESNNTQLTANDAAPEVMPDNNKTVGSNDNDMWTIAEMKLRADPQKRKKLEEYDSILENHFGSKLKDLGTLERRKQFLELLNSEIHILNNINSDSQLSGCSRKAKRCFKSAVGCVVASKSIITTAASPCLPAAVACAGVMVLLSVGQSVIA
jgi:hypothetical protein